MVNSMQGDLWYMEIEIAHSKNETCRLSKLKQRSESFLRVLEFGRVPTAKHYRHCELSHLCIWQMLLSKQCIQPVTYQSACELLRIVTDDDGEVDHDPGGQGDQGGWHENLLAVGDQGRHHEPPSGKDKSTFISTPRCIPVSKKPSFLRPSLPKCSLNFFANMSANGKLQKVRASRDQLVLRCSGSLFLLRISVRSHYTRRRGRQMDRVDVDDGRVWY
ncbi:hypothetical protein IRJ41_019381 [Triplophysa rosa]|uniref:Uncharacterized protein n=1 Tax=Triplophysa rosa TaxID=992332 RepID=A0A9W7TVC6_TRIRA|nr:hypothetical protein IRJ41_019381 [Triplophysa rosa]